MTSTSHVAPPGAPCPDLDRLVADAASGRAGAGARLDAHAASCAACAAEARLADDGSDLDDLLACLRGTPAPEAVVAAALAAARRPERTVPSRAPDRAAVPTRGTGRRARRLWAPAAALGLVAVLVSVLLGLPEGGLETDPRNDAGLVAAQREPEIRARPVTPRVTPPAPPTALPEAALPTTARSEATRPRLSAAPGQTPAALSPTDLPAPPDSLAPDMALAAPDLVALTPTPADSAAARADLLFALGIVARAQRTADAAVLDEMRRMSEVLVATRVL